MLRPVTHFCSLLTLLGLILTILSPMQANASMSEFRQLFLHGQCNQLKQPLKTYRLALIKEGRRNLQIDYMLAACLCPSPGAEALRKLPHVYRHLTRSDIDQVKHMAWNCSSGAEIVEYIPPGRAIVSGKGGSRFVEAKSSQMSDRLADQYAARIFDKSEREKAVNAVKSAGFHSVVTTPNFVLTGDVGEAALSQAGQLMEKVLKGFHIRFGFEQTRTLITVYLFKNRNEMRQHARTMHDIEVSPELWAYTFPLDASITIWHSGGLGTVGHEVLHALLDQNAPYLPPWLNEGAAALFEEFRLTPDGRIQGTFRQNHWRLQYLHDGDIPRLDALLAMDWGEFDQPGGLQANHATAKFFAMFLQEKKWLGTLLDAYSQNDLFAHTQDERIFKKLLGNGVDAVAREFEQWLAAKVGVSSAKDVLESLTLTNSARYLGRQSDMNRYEWTVYMRGPERSLNQIESVTYHLHKTFANPVRLGDRSRKGHPLTSRGWGVFTLKARVTLKNGASREYTHRLNF